MSAFKAFFYTGTVVQLLTAPVHLVGTLQKPVATNDQEKTLFDLFAHYQFAMGAGIERSLGDFFLGFSLEYSVFMLIVGLINVFALRQAGNTPFIRSLCWLNVLCMAAGTIIAFKLFFLIPLVFSAVPLLAFLGAAITAPKTASI